MQTKILCIVFSLFLSANCYASYSIEYYPNGENYSGVVLSSDENSYSAEPRVSHKKRYEYAASESYESRPHHHHTHSSEGEEGSLSLLPQQISSPGEEVIIVNPNVHAWGAYSSDGRLLRSGLASAGSKWCPDLGRPCRTKAGTFRIYSLGSEDCVSSKFPLGEGGAPMPYCMYFNGSQGLHGSHELAQANISHGCVRMRVSDARWLRYNFAHIGTKVIVKPY